jgi:putative acyl-CoA dehydrogenase
MLTRLYREAPLYAIWEGSGNVMCLDVLRALAREADDARAVLAALARVDLPGMRDATAFVAATLSAPAAEARARAAVEQLALVAAAAALAESAPAPIAEMFAATRLARRRGTTYGTAPLDSDAMSLLLGRALPG